MNTSFVFLVLIFLISYASAAQTVEFENDDGSYSIGHSVSTRGNTGDSVYALLTRASGWTENTDDYTANEKMRQNEIEVEVSSTKLPYSEILRMVQAFLVLKGEVASKLTHLVAENSHIIKAVVTTLIGKLGTLHKFTLAGIVILRKILEFAVQLFGQWSVNVDVTEGFSSLFS